jgi:cytochrome c-type biogenesis protein CcmF
MTISSPFVGTYELTYLDLNSPPKPNPNIEIVEATLQVSRDGQVLGTIQPYREFFVQQQQPMTIPDTHREFATELYVIVAGWEGNGESATFKAFINPLINWIWLGGIVFVLGTIVAAWPDSQPVRRATSVELGKGMVPVK